MSVNTLGHLALRVWKNKCYSANFFAFSFFFMVQVYLPGTHLFLGLHRCHYKYGLLQVSIYEDLCSLWLLQCPFPKLRKPKLSKMRFLAWSSTFETQKEKKYFKSPQILSSSRRFTTRATVIWWCGPILACSHFTVGTKRYIESQKKSGYLTGTHLFFDKTEPNWGGRLIIWPLMRCVKDYV